MFSWFAKWMKIYSRPESRSINTQYNDIATTAYLGKVEKTLFFST